uniref:Uncharacterized protein n=1 Tax=Arundo donax TaxID=35708 RepID=A0A0A9BWB8_ARUDO
MLKQSVNTD